MKQDIYKNILQNSSFAFAYHKIIVDDTGKPIDYVFLEVNSEFEKTTGLKASKIINRKISEVIPELITTDFDWIAQYGDIALNGGVKEFEIYAEFLKKWFRIKVYSPEKYYFTVIFTDISIERLIANLSKHFLQKDKSQPDYQNICDDILTVTNAQYIALNLTEENGKDFRTVAISGVNKAINKAASILGFELIGKTWKYDPDRAKRIENSIITRFKSLADVAGKAFSKKSTPILEGLFQIGEFVVIKIMKDGRMLGDFTVIMEKGERLKNESLWELLAQQMGLFIENLNAEQKKYLAEKKHYDTINSLNEGYIKADKKGIIIEVNRTLSNMFGYNSDYEIVGKPMKEFYANPNDRDKMIAEIKQEKILLNYELELKRKDGSTFWTASNIRYVEDEKGEYLETIGLIRDVTERRELKKLNEMLLSSLPHPAMYIRAKDRVVLAANKIALDFGAKIGGQCWREFGKSDYISEKHKEIAKKYPDFVPPEYGIKCSFCQGDECFTNGPEQNNPEVQAFGLFWDTYWIKVSSDVYLHYAVNITERKEAEKLLRESEESYRGLYENATLGIYRTTPDGKILMANPALLKMLGYRSFKELAKSNLEEDWYESDYSRKDFIKQILVSGSVNGLESAWKIKNGETIYVLENARVVYDENNKPLYFEGFVEDITEKKRTEQLMLARISLIDFAENHTVQELLKQTLKEAELLTNSKIGFYNFYNEALGVVVIGIWSEATEKNFCKVEVEFGTHYQLDKAGVWVDCIHKRKPVIHNNYESLKHKKGMPQGHAKLIRELVVPIFRKKRIVAILAVGNKPVNYKKEDIKIISQLADLAYDIIEKKQAETAVIQSEEKHRFLIENTENIFWSFDIIKNRWTYVAPQVKRILGYDPEEWTDNDFWENNIHQEDREQSVAYCLKTTAKGADHSFEYRFRKKDGNYAWIYDEVKVVMQDGKPVSMWGFMKDISERKKYEKVLKNYERIFTHTNDMLCILGLDGFLKDINPRWQTMTGWNKEELLSKPCIDFINADDLNITNEALTKAYNGKKVLRFENRFICKDKSEKWFLWDFIPYRNENVIIGVARDNSSNVVLEKEKEAFNRMLIERVKELSFLNSFTKLVYNSQAKPLQLFKQVISLMPHAFRFPEKTFMKISGKDLELKSNDFKITNINLNESFNTDSYGKVNITLFVDATKANNQFYFYNEEVNLLKTVADILGSYIQKTEAIEKEKLSEQKFEELFDNVNDIVFTAKPNGNLIKTNFEFERQLGLKFVPGISIFSLLTPYSSNRFKKLLKQNISKKVRQVFADVEIVNKKGITRTYETRLNIKYKSAKASEIFGIARDVTDLRSTQNLLMKTIIDTEEKERAHFAEELHDGIGPLLSGISMYLHKILAKESIPVEEAKLLTYCNELVNDTVSQIRIISNDLMPHLLYKYGLSKALSSFIDKINPLDDISINLIGSKIKAHDIPNDTSIIIYRCISELINNTFKHSRAKNILINIIKRSKHIIIEYSDDGQGFSIKNLYSTKKQSGLGIRNLISRVKSINGSVNFPEKEGFQAVIDIPVSR